MVAILCSTWILRQLWSSFGEYSVTCHHEFRAVDQFGECTHLGCSMADLSPLRYHLTSDSF